MRVKGFLGKYDTRPDPVETGRTALPQACKPHREEGKRKYREKHFESKNHCSTFVLNRFPSLS